MALAVKHENDRTRVCWGPTCIYIRNITLHYAALHYIPLHSIPLHYIYHYISIYSKASAHITRITHTNAPVKKKPSFFPISGDSPNPGRIAQTRSVRVLRDSNETVFAVLTGAGFFLAALATGSGGFPPAGLWPASSTTGD